MKAVCETLGVARSNVAKRLAGRPSKRMGRPPSPIEWLSDNGSGDIAGDAKQFTRKISLEPLTPPVESPQLNGMAEAFVRAIKRDDARVSSLPDAKTASACCQRGSSATTRAIGIVRLAIVHPASSWRIVRLPKPESACPILEGLQHIPLGAEKATRKTYAETLENGYENQKSA